MVIRVDVGFEHKSLLTAILAASGITQEALAATVGVTPQTIRRSERDGCTVKTAMAAIAALDLAGDKQLLAGELASGKRVKITAIEVQILEEEGEG